MTREVMLVGSAPLDSAMSVFKCACDHGLKPLVRRMPDGEQTGWVEPLLARWMKHPALAPACEPLPPTRRPSGLALFNAPMPVLSLKPGHSADELMVADMGVARGFEASYAEFKRAKAEGIVAPETRFVATVPGPAAACMCLDVPPAELFPVMSRMYRDEIARILKIAPLEELAIQLDIAGEVGAEEHRRRPAVWDSPLWSRLHPNWPFREAVALLGEIANAVPEPVELGFHFCATYHVDESQGQDLQVHVDWANAMTEQLRRPIDYVHLPTTPYYTAKDFEPLRQLKLNPRTKVYLGVIHAEDGIEGAKRRIKAAAEVRPDFGIASYCGLRVMSVEQSRHPVAIEDVFELHRAAAEVD